MHTPSSGLICMDGRPRYNSFFWLFQVITQFKEQGLNTELYYKNKEMGETFSIVPTSAIR